MRNQQLTFAFLAAAFAALLVAAIALLYDPREPQGQSATEETTAAPAAEPIAPAAAAEPNRAASPVEERIAAAPDVSPFFVRLKSALPQDYAYILDWLDHAENMNDPDVMLSEASKILRQRYRSISAQAQGAALDAIFDRQRAILEALGRQNPKSCAAYLSGSVDASFAQTAGENRVAILNLALAGLDAILDGQQYHIQRKTPTEDDFKVLEESLTQQGVGAAEIDVLLDGKISDPPPADDKLCAAGVTYLKLLEQLPDDQRQRIYALAIELQGRN